ncbi:MAG: phosphoribosylanthranilate isomerase [Microcystis sp.]|jgi:phosphoribosylanthranilate isomerase|uniref:phosphoribosylanthranilate isomerase n=1 Tax=unclassified Microcystis TaxID=2643300 RepID=UPI0022BE2CC0|nr:phosphoribosylanthranilate isomerase [Microcystis sp. LE19-195.1E]MCZ8247988.1 phosphoribosylanthranilate isomerase [Microcystis sp. LE19-195.1E]
MIRVKICGNRTIEDVLLSVNSGADALGLIVGTKYYSEDKISPDFAGTLLEKIPPLVNTVLVTHLQSSQEIIKVYSLVPTSTIQLHNDISIEEIQAIKHLLPHVKLIKAVHVVDERAIETAQYFAPFTDAILLDSRTTGRIGGTGKTHDWSISRKITSLISKPVILAGGLNPDNILQAIECVNPFGVDVNSGVDTSSGDKDPDKIRKFVDVCKRIR